MTREEMTPTLKALNDRHVHKRLRDISAKDKRNVGVCDVELDMAKGVQRGKGVSE